jgi:hypothetical protein
MRPRDSWRVVAIGIFALGGVLLAGGAGYWHYANHVPAYPPLNTVMPAPNAYDDYVAAGRLCKAAGGSVVRAQPVVRTASGSSFNSRAAVGSAAGAGRLPDPPMPSNPLPPRADETGVPLAQVRAVVARNRPALARLRQGFRKTYRNPPVQTFDQTFPEIDDFRELGRVLLTEGKLAEREGRLDHATRSYLDCLRLGVDVPRGGGLLHGIEGLQIQKMGLQALLGLVDRLDGRTAAAAAREMSRLDAQAPTAAEVLSTEKEWYTAGLLEKLERTKVWREFAAWPNVINNTSPVVETLTALQFSFTPKRRIIDEVRREMDALIAAARRPYYAATPAPPQSDYLMWRIFVTRNAFEGASEWWAQRNAHWRIAQARLAVQTYEQQHGALPPSLSALVPAYLSAVPQDPYAPQPLVYRRQGTRALVYSRGSGASLLHD